MNLWSLLFGAKADSIAVSASKNSIPVSPSNSGSSWTSAQLKFLGVFLKGSECPSDDKSYWISVLGKAPSKEARYMIEAGLLKPAPLEAKLDSTYKATELKAMLKERGLPVSGKKFDCIARLVLVAQST